MNGSVPTVWVFHGTGARFASGVFATRDAAESWIAQHRLSGLLTEYPLGVGVYQWAVDRGAFVPKHEAHASPSFIGSFSSASQAHAHYEDGNAR